MGFQRITSISDMLKLLKIPSLATGFKRVQSMFISFESFKNLLPLVFFFLNVGESIVQKTTTEKDCFSLSVPVF